VLPQALRTVIPPLVGFAIILYQATSLAYAISTPELLSRAYNTPSTASRALVDAAFPATTVGVIGVLAEEPTEDQIEQA
jgi:polar amino acid transport system permease protein